MLYTPHFLTGAAIVKMIPNPVIGLPLAFLSHILLDLLPHYDFGIKPGMKVRDILNMKEKRTFLLLGALVFDIILMIVAFLWLFFTKSNFLMLLGGIVAILPDVAEQGLLILGIPLSSLQDKFQCRVSPKYGFISYPIVSFLAALILLGENCR